MPPREKHDADPLPVVAVSAAKTNVTDGGEALHGHRFRWTIETRFRTLKSGTRVKGRRLTTPMT